MLLASPFKGHPMSPDYQIITQDLCLRLIENSESDQFAQLVRTSPQLHKWVDWCHADFSLEESERFLLATRLNWVKADSYGFGVFDRATDQLLGMVAINELYHTFNMASLGYWIGDIHHRKGIAKKALEALVEFCFAQLKVTRLEIVCDPDNVPSQRLVEACGATFEAEAANRYIFSGKPKTGLVYSIIPGAC